MPRQEDFIDQLRRQAEERELAVATAQQARTEAEAARLRQVAQEEELSRQWRAERTRLEEVRGQPKSWFFASFIPTIIAEANGYSARISRAQGEAVEVVAVAAEAFPSIGLGDYWRLEPVRTGIWILKSETPRIINAQSNESFVQGYLWSTNRGTNAMIFEVTQAGLLYVHGSVSGLVNNWWNNMENQRAAVDFGFKNPVPVNRDYDSMPSDNSSYSDRF